MKTSFSFAVALLLAQALTPAFAGQESGGTGDVFVVMTPAARAAVRQYYQEHSRRYRQRTDFSPSGSSWMDAAEANRLQAEVGLEMILKF